MAVGRSACGHEGLDDAQLAALMAAGSARAFDVLYRRHAHAVHGVAASILRDRDRAEDLVQEAFLELWRSRRGRASGRAPVQAWLLAVARNRSIDVLRAQARDSRRLDAARQLARAAEGQTPDPPVATISRDESRRLRAALATVPPLQRRSLVLAYGGGLTHEEVAQRTGVPVGTVKSRLRLGQARIARRLGTGPRTAAA